MVLPSDEGYRDKWSVAWKGGFIEVMMRVSEKLPSPLGVKVPFNVTLKTSPPNENDAMPLVVPFAKKVSRPAAARATWPDRPFVGVGTKKPVLVKT